MDVGIHCAKRSRRHAKSRRRNKREKAPEGSITTYLDRCVVCGAWGRHRSEIRSWCSGSDDTRVDRHVLGVKMFDDDTVVDLYPLHALANRATRRRISCRRGGEPHERNDPSGALIVY